MNHIYIFSYKYISWPSNEWAQNGFQLKNTSVIDATGPGLVFDDGPYYLLVHANVGLIPRLKSKTWVICTWAPIHLKKQQSSSGLIELFPTLLCLVTSRLNGWP